MEFCELSSAVNQALSSVGTEVVQLYISTKRSLRLRIKIFTGLRVTVATSSCVSLMEFRTVALTREVAMGFRSLHYEQHNTEGVRLPGQGSPYYIYAYINVPINNRTLTLSCMKYELIYVYIYSYRIEIEIKSKVTLSFPSTGHTKHICMYKLDIFN